LKYVPVEFGGYEGMDDDEIERVIISKYAGKNSMLDRLAMMGELWRSGVLPDKMGTSAASEFLSSIASGIETAFDSHGFTEDGFGKSDFYAAHDRFIEMLSKGTDYYGRAVKANVFDYIDYNRNHMIETMGMSAFLREEKAQADAGFTVGPKMPQFQSLIDDLLAKIGER